MPPMSFARLIRGPTFALLVTVWSAGAAAQPPTQVASPGLAGAGDVVCIFRRTPSTNDTGPVWAFTYHRVTPRSAPAWFRTLGSWEATGEVRQVVVRGDRVHVIFGDGTHRIYGPPGSTVGLRLPRSAIPLALAADPLRDTLYALVARYVGEALGDEPAESTTDPISPGGSRPDSADGSPPPTSEPSPRAQLQEQLRHWQASKYVLLRYDKGRWHFDRGLPDGFDPTTNAWLAVREAAVTVVVASPPDAAHYQSFKSASPDAAWTPPRPIDGIKSAGVLALADGPAGTVLVADAGSGNVRALTATENGWEAGQVFTLGNASWVRPDGGAVFGGCVAGVIAAWTAPDASIQVAAWNAGDGRPVAPGGPQPVLTGQATLRRNWYLEWTAYGILGMVLVFVAVQRRRLAGQAISLPAQHRLAPHGRRLVAFVIDACIFSPVAGYAFSPLVPHVDLQADVASQMVFLSEEIGNQALARYVAILAGFITYTIIFEAWWAATPGKRLLRCRVVAEQGGPCKLGQVVLRNVLRCVELFPGLSLLPTLILIPLTRNRQRVGDLLARTVVVAELPPAPQ